MGESYVQLPPQSTGLKLRTRQRTVSAQTVEEQIVIPQALEVVSFRGRASSFRIPGRAGTAGQKILALWNAVGSPVLVQIGEVRADIVQTVIKAVTVLPPVVRVHRITAIPTNGTAGPKTSLDTALSSSSSVTTYQDASADGTGSGTALTVTIPAANILSEEFAPRYITAVGYEPADRMGFLTEADLVLRAGEGIAVELAYTLATQNPTTDMWLASVEWMEYTLP